MGRTKKEISGLAEGNAQARPKASPAKKLHLGIHEPRPVGSLCRSGTRTAEEGEGIGVRITQHYWNQVQPVNRTNRPRPITREEPRPWDTPNAARERARLQKMEKAMDGVGWTAAIITGLLILLVIIVQVGKRFYGW